MNLLPITGLYAGLLALLFIALSINVIRFRLKYKVGLGDGNEKVLAKKVRIHGNFAEYIPLALILLAVAEINGASTMLLHSMGALLFVGRFLHAIGISKSTGTSRERQFGTLSVFIVLLVLAINHIIHFAF